MSPHVHTWKYLFGQGRWYRCGDSTCRQLGDAWAPTSATPIKRGDITPTSCGAPSCDRLATRLSKNGPRCKEHRS